MPAEDAWKRHFPTADLLEVVDALAELVADRVAARLEAKGVAILRFLPAEPEGSAA